MSTNDEQKHEVSLTRKQIDSLVVIASESVLQTFRTANQMARDGKMTDANQLRSDARHIAEAVDVLAEALRRTSDSVLYTRRPS